MKRILLLLTLIGLCLIALMLTAHAQTTLQITPDQSVGVLSEDPGYGERWSTEIFPFGNYTGPVSGKAVFCRTYLRFPLGRIPAGSIIQAATLSVYVDDYWPAPGGAPISVYPVLVDWTPAGVDWYNMAAWPALGSGVATTWVTSEGGWFTWDVTALVREWASGVRPNYGLALAAADLGSTAANWAAARRLSANEPATRPHLSVSYIAPTATPASPQPTAPPALPPTPVLTPTPIPILLPETGGASAGMGYWFLGVGLAIWVLAILMVRGRRST